MSRSKTRGVYVAICASALQGLSGCSLPGSGPSTSDVVNQATVEQTLRYEVVDIDPTVVETLRRWGSEGFASRFGDRKLTTEPVIGVGDVVAVTIWEAGSGGLFSTPQTTEKVSAGSNSATIPEQVVGRDGGITVPYAGRVPVVGKTTRAVQQTIEQALEGKALQPQVLVNVTKATSDSVSVGGEVTMGARVPLSVRGDRILDVIAAAGGEKSPVNQTFVELSRGSTTSRIALTRIIAHPNENIYMHPDDVLTLVLDPQKFLAYGATGQNAEIPFDADGITLAEALTKAGGLNDSRSDPQGVFIFRYEAEPIARAILPDSPLVRRGRLTPIVYRLNLTDPNGLFLQQQFRMANRDLVYVSNSSSSQIQKVFEIFAPALSTAGSVASIGLATTTSH
jgi:polysaccharide export outer membrane protein